MLNRLRSFLIVFFFIPILLTACKGNTPSISPKIGATIISQATKASVGEGGEGGAEAALVTYSDSQMGFSVGHPGTWTQDKSFTKGMKFVGGDDSMTLELVTLPAGKDALTYAKNDVVSVTAAFPGFKQVGFAASTEVQNAIVLGFEANGTSLVTGKPYSARGDRYYLPLPDGRIAVLTVIGPNNHYDREGVRDIALTLNFTK